jgi:hypothetical protein
MAVPSVQRPSAVGTPGALHTRDAAVVPEADWHDAPLKFFRS